MLKKHISSKKQSDQIKKTHHENASKGLTSEEICQIASQMSLGCWMLPPGCFPYGYWYLF